MPKNPYLETENLPISTEEPKRVNPYLSARVNPYLEAAEVPILERGVEPSLFQRGKEAVTDFFRKDPGLGPLTEEDYAAFKPADVLIPEEPVAEPTITGVPALDIEGQLPPVEPIEPIDPTLAMAGLTPEEAALGRPISAITGKPIPTPEEVAASGRAAMAIIPYGFASAVRGVVPPVLERAVMDPLTKAIVGKEYVSPIDEALKIGEYLPEEAQAAVGVPAHMAGAIVPLGVSFKTANAMMKAAGLPADLVLRTGPVMDRIAGHVARGGLAGAVYGGLEAGTPKGMAEDAAFFGALEGGLGAVGGIFRKTFSANWYRNLEVKERGLVVQSLDDMLNRGYSEGEILRQWDNPAWRAEALARRMEVEPVTRLTTKDIAKEVIREELIKRPEAPVAVMPKEPIPAVLPTEIVPEVPPITPEPIPELPPVLEELAIERKPILSTYGTPWKTEARASLALKSKRLKDMGITEETHEVVSVEDGFGVVEKIEEVIEPEIIPEIEKEPIAEIPPEIPIELEKMSLPELLSAHEKGGAFNLENKEPETSWEEPCRAKFEELTGEKWSPKTVRKIKEEVVPEIEIPKKPVIEAPPVKEEIPAEPVKPEAIAIPEFKNTEEALAFGKTATSEQIEALKIKRDESLSKSDVLKAKGDLQGALDEATKGQFFREAIESAEKEIVEPKKVEKPIAEVPEKKPWKTSKTEFLRPVKAAAYLDKKTGKIIEGTPEEVHFQIAEKANLSLKDIEVRYEPGFTSHKGEFLTREEANKLIRRPDRKTQLIAHKEFVQEALKSGDLTPEKYAELHEKDYGPLAEFMPEVVKAPPEVPEIKEIPEVPKIPEAPKDVVKPIPEVKKAEVGKLFEPDLAAMPLEKITVETKALRETTGEMVTTKENAKEALARIDEEIAKYKKLLECL